MTSHAQASLGATHGYTNVPLFLLLPIPHYVVMDENCESRGQTRCFVRPIIVSNGQKFRKSVTSYILPQIGGRLHRNFWPLLTMISLTKQRVCQSWFLSVFLWLSSTQNQKFSVATSHHQSWLVATVLSRDWSQLVMTGHEKHDWSRKSWLVMTEE